MVAGGGWWWLVGLRWDYEMLYHIIISTIRTGQEISLGNMAVSVSRPTQWEENVVDLSKPVLVPLTNLLL